MERYRGNNVSLLSAVFFIEKYETVNKKSQKYINLDYVCKRTIQNDFTTKCGKIKVTRVIHFGEKKTQCC